MSGEFELLYKRDRGFELCPIATAPVPEAGRVLVRPRYVGICGSDLHQIETAPGELRLGHEWVGIVEKIAPGAAFTPGDVVTSPAQIGCGNCARCLAGRTNHCRQAVILGGKEMAALRSWLVLPEHCLIPMKGPLSPDQTLFEIAGVATEGLRILQNYAPLRRGASIAIFGGGAVGTMTALLARLRGLKPLLIEPTHFRLELAGRLGIKGMLLDEALLDRSLRNHFEHLIDASCDRDGAPGAFGLLPIFAQSEFAALIVAKYVRMPILSKSLFAMSGKLLWMRGVPQNSFALANEEWNALLDAGAGTLISGVFPIEKASEAFAAASNVNRSMKTVIELGNGKRKDDCANP